MPKPYDLNLHKSYNVNNNDKNYKSFTDANGEQWYTDKPLTTYNNNKLAYVTNGRHSKWVIISDQFNTQPQTLAREQAVNRDRSTPRIQAANSLTQGLADIITGGMAGSLRDGAQNLTKVKTHQAFIDNAEAGPYDFHQQTGEAAMNGRDLGHDLGISVGQSYPGYQKALETLNSGLGKSTKDEMIKLFKTDEQSMPYVWKLLNGTLLGGALMTKINTNK